MAGSIQDRGQDWNGKRWRARYWAKDGRQRSRSFTRKGDAEKWLRGELAKMDRGDWLDPRAGKTTVADWCTQYVAGLDVKPKTRYGYESLLASRIIPYFGDWELRQVTPASVRQWVSEMATDEGVGPATVRQARGLLHAALEVAVVDELIARNPVANVKAPTLRKRRQLFLNASQVAALVEEADRISPGSGTLILVLAYSGMRWGEAVALKKSAVSVSRRRIRVKASATEVGGELVFGSPKSNEARTIILPLFVMDQLAEHMQKVDDDELVFTAPRGGPLRASNFRRRIWAKACEASGMPEGLLIHDLRDTAASLAISTGASIKAVQRMLGHASAAMTLDTYGSLFTEDLEILADRMQERFAEIHKTSVRPRVVNLPRNA